MPIMQKRLNFDRVMIMLIQEDSGVLEYVASYGHTQEQKEVLKQTRFNLKNPKARGPFVMAVKEQRPFLRQLVLVSLPGCHAVMGADFTAGAS